MKVLALARHGLIGALFGLAMPAGAASDAEESLANVRAALLALESRNSELESANRELADKAGKLEHAGRDQAVEIARLKQALSAGHAAARKYSATTSRRLYRNASRHMAAMPAVAIPYVGAGVTAAMTGLDLREACDALRDLNDMNRAMQLEPENEAQVCAMHVGLAGREEIINKVMANWRTAYAVAAAWANQQETWLAPEPVPVEPARANELWTAVFGVSPGFSVRPAAPAARGPAAPVPPMAPAAPVLPNYPAR